MFRQSHGIESRQSTELILCPMDLHKVPGSLLRKHYYRYQFVISEYRYHAWSGLLVTGLAVDRVWQCFEGEASERSSKILKGSKRRK